MTPYVISGLTSQATLRPNPQDRPEANRKTNLWLKRLAIRNLNPLPTSESRLKSKSAVSSVVKCWSNSRTSSENKTQAGSELTSPAPPEAQSQYMSLDHIGCGSTPSATPSENSLNQGRQIPMTLTMDAPLPGLSLMKLVPLVGSLIRLPVAS